MIITRTPFRLSFAGGGSDLREFYSRNGYGAVVSTSINRYMYIAIHPYFHDKIRIKYSRTEDVDNVDQIKHSIVRECLKKVRVGKGIEIASFADVPAGTGLGSSSSFTVGLLNALYAYKGKLVSKERLAREACEIEIDLLKEPIGKQDQYAAAYGGLNFIKFDRDEGVEVSPVGLAESTQRKLERSLSLYYIGGQRLSRSILREQRENTKKEKQARNLEKMVGLAEELRDALDKGDVGALGGILHRGWLYKRELASEVANSRIDVFYEEALKAGATGGKLLGAGGSGFFLLHSRDHKALKELLGCRVLPFNIDRGGTRVIFYE